MPQTDRVVETVRTDLSQPRTYRRPGWRWVLMGLAVLIALGLTLGYSYWWTRPTTFTDVGNGFRSKQTTDALHPVTFDMVQPSVHVAPESITLRDVSPRVVTNTADALITFAVCHRSGTPFMSAEGPAARSCETVTDVEDQQLRLAPDPTTTITMTVTPRHVGRVVIEGMEVAYTRGAGHLWQRGTQATGPIVTIRVSE